MATPVDLETLLRTSDVLTVHVDGRASNKHYLSTHQLNLLQPNALLLNTSRGFVIDGEALVAMLVANPDCSAVLDVHELEPISADDPLLRLPNATLLPHSASRTAAAQRAMSWVVQGVWKAVQGAG